MAISKPSRNLHRRFRRRKIEKTNKTKPKILYRKYQWTNDYGKFTKKKNCVPAWPYKKLMYVKFWLWLTNNVPSDTHTHFPLLFNFNLLIFIPFLLHLLFTISPASLYLVTTKSSAIVFSVTSLSSAII